MPVTFAHLPFLVLFFLIVALPGGVSLLLLLVPSSRLAGKRLFFGSSGAAVGLISYQIAYIPVCLLLVLLGALVGRYLPSAVIAGLLLLIFYVFWFVVLMCGYVSGFRVGWRFGNGILLSESVRRDWLCRIFLSCLHRFRKKKPDDTAA